MANENTNQFKLSQTTTQIQDILDLLTNNSFDTSPGHYMLVSNGNKGVMFMRNVHGAGDGYITVDSNNAITVDTYRLKNALDIPSAELFEQSENKVEQITSIHAANKDKYPNVAAVLNLFNTLGVRIKTDTYITPNWLETQFKNKQLVSNILYIATLKYDNDSDPNNDADVMPCIYIQAGNISTVSSKVSLLALYGNTWHTIEGTVQQEAVVVDTADNSKSNINQFATVAYVQNAISGALTQEY